MVDAYNNPLRCTNCNFMGEYQIPKGVTIVDFILNSHCLNCGCKLA
ncbi:MAG: hypothetical protein WCV90_01895 [Candidatus Woesearchaeota archaeon]|jgi:hypothetical protein